MRECFHLFADDPVLDAVSGEFEQGVESPCGRTASPSAVPCTSTKRPEPVITTFMSVSQVGVLGVIQVEHRARRRPCRPTRRRRSRFSGLAAEQAPR
jgi:hypothetical protein